MPRLLDLLAWLARPEADPSVWVLLDIKTDDDPELLLPAIARTIASVPLPGGGRGWKERVVIGCWNVCFPLLLLPLLVYPSFVPRVVELIKQPAKLHQPRPLAPPRSPTRPHLLLPTLCPPLPRQQRPPRRALQPVPVLPRRAPRCPLPPGCAGPRPAAICLDGE